MPSTASIEELRSASKRLDAVEFAFFKFPHSFEHFFMACPLPSWVKRSDGVMILSNRAYEAAYDIPSLTYVGTLDVDQWSEEEADGFGYLDRKAVETNGVVFGVEWITLPMHSKRQALFVTKWPVRWDDEGVPTHIAGQVLGSITLANMAGVDGG